MPPNNVPANIPSNWSSVAPAPIDPGLGLGAFIVLEYTSTVGSRLEHCILFVAKEWDSMYDLIRAPGVFMENLRKAYKSTPEHDHGSIGNVKWEFNTPISIVIEPLTSPTPANKVALMGLSKLYPALMEAMDDGLGAHEFSARVKEASSKAPEGFTWSDKVPPMVPTEVELSDPSARGESKTKRASQVTLNVEENWAADLPKVSSSGTYTSGAAESPTSPPVGAEFFPLQYVAEFALKTRTLYIRYIPHETTHAGTFGDRPGDEITAITVNPVQGINMTFLHQDIVFSKSELTPSILADRRARFAMNFITDIRFLNQPSLLQVTPPAYLSTSPLLYAMSTVTLPTPTHVPTTRPEFHPFAVENGKQTGASAPSVFIDSVWPDPDQITFSDADKQRLFPLGNPTPEPDSPSPLCTVVVSTPVVQPNGTIIFVTSELIIKSYEPEIPGQHGGGG